MEGEGERMKKGKRERQREHTEGERKGEGGKGVDSWGTERATESFGAAEAWDRQKEAQEGLNWGVQALYYMSTAGI